MDNFIRISLRVIIVIQLLILAACNLPLSTNTSTTATTGASLTPIPTQPQKTIEQPTSAQKSPPTAVPQETSQVFLPEIIGLEQPTPGAVASTPAPIEPADTLAFLRGGDLLLVDFPSGTPRQITQVANLLSYAWAPDGSRLATFDGHSLCLINPDGSSNAPCIDLGIDDAQAVVERPIVWSPDQRAVVLWNPVNPWDEEAIGWIYVTLDGSNVIYRITDPVDWGLNLAPNNDPGGIAGQPVFLADGTLVGTFTHRWLCGSGGCHFQLYRFDPQQRSLIPYPNKPDEGWSEGQSLAISNDRRILVNVGTFSESCDSYFTFLDAYDLTTQTRKAFNLPQEAISGVTLSPDAMRVVLVRVAGCSSQDQAVWAAACGLSPSLDVYGMQIMELSNGNRTDLAPGVTPDWSTDSKWIAFRSCLTPDAKGGWDPSPNGPPAIYITPPDGASLVSLGEGTMPQWKP